jgi:hypothetical protein
MQTWLGKLPAAYAGAVETPMPTTRPIAAIALAARAFILSVIRGILSAIGTLFLRAGYRCTCRTDQAV